MILNIKQPTIVNKLPFKSQVEIFKTLTHPVRVAILYMLRDDEHCVCHFSATLGYRQAYISQQLSVLREAGLIQDRRDGWNIYYRVVNPLIFEVLDAVQEITDEQIAMVPASRSACACPHCSPKVAVAG